nr:hypothetical protein [Tanacetum cinerariifolium]
GVSGGGEVILHAVNRLIEDRGDDVGISMLLVDFKNALNLVDRELDDGTIIGDTLVVGKVLELIMEDGPRCGLHLNVDKTEGLASGNGGLPPYPFYLGGWVFILQPCLACSMVFAGDIYGDHAVSCAGIIGINHRHNLVRDTLVDICYRSGISFGKEDDIGLDGGRDKPLRPADMLFYSWDRGLDVCVDLTGSSPLTQTEMTGFMSGHAVIDAVQRKRVKYDTKCAAIGYGFLPFSFSSSEEL